MEAKQVNTLDQNELYTARLEFRSIGNGIEVQPSIVFSHNFPDSYDGEYPSAFLAMRDMSIFLSLQKRNVEVDGELPTDADELARVAIGVAQAEKSTKN